MVKSLGYTFAGIAIFALSLLKGVKMSTAFGCACRAFKNEALEDCPDLKIAH